MTNPGGLQSCVYGCVWNRLGLHDAQHLTNHLIWKTIRNVVMVSHRKLPHGINRFKEGKGNVLFYRTRLTVSTQNFFSRHQISPVRRSGHTAMYSGRKGRRRFDLYSHQNKHKIEKTLSSSSAQDKAPLSQQIHNQEVCFTIFLYQWRSFLFTLTWHEPSCCNWMNVTSSSNNRS